MCWRSGRPLRVADADGERRGWPPAHEGAPAGLSPAQSSTARAAVQSSYPEQFERDMACTVAEWLQALPAAIGAHPCALQDGAARVALGHGVLALRWVVLPPRVIARMRLPRLLVRFEFQDVPPAERIAFMQRFDLYTQRGGG